MMIAVAGPYSAPTAAQRQQNLDAMNRAARSTPLLSVEKKLFGGARVKAQDQTY